MAETDRSVPTVFPLLKCPGGTEEGSARFFRPRPAVHIAAEGGKGELNEYISPASLFITVRECHMSQSAQCPARRYGLHQAQLSVVIFT